MMLGDIVIRVLANGNVVYAVRQPDVLRTYILGAAESPKIVIDYTGAARGRAISSSVWTGPVVSPGISGAFVHARLPADAEGDVRHVATFTGGESREVCMCVERRTNGY